VQRVDGGVVVIGGGGTVESGGKVVVSSGRLSLVDRRSEWVVGVGHDDVAVVRRRGERRVLNPEVEQRAAQLTQDRLSIADGQADSFVAVRVAGCLCEVRFQFCDPVRQVGVSLLGDGNPLC